MSRYYESYCSCIATSRNLKIIDFDVAFLKDKKKILI